VTGFEGYTAWLEPYLTVSIAGIRIYDLAIAFAILFATLVARRVITEVAMRRLHALSVRTQITWDEDLVEAARPPLRSLILIYGLWLATAALLRSLEVPAVETAMATIGRVAVLVVCAWLSFRMVNVFDRVLYLRGRDPDDWIEMSLVPLAINAVRLLVYIVFGLVIAQNLGYSVGGIVASLGLGGAALALASQDTLSNLFGSFMIIVDKPFVVGDWIKGDSFEGVVEQIGFRSTRIRTFGKTVENIPNNLLANVKVENMDRRKDPGLNVRRIKMTLGVTYSTSADQMERVLEGIREILRSDPGVAQQQTILVRFTDFGDSALDIFLYYFADRADWDYYLSVRERVNLKVMRLLESMGLEIAFPSRSLYIESLPEGLSIEEGRADN
jgi:MscS family membrane protein